MMVFDFMHEDILEVAVPEVENYCVAVIYDLAEALDVADVVGDFEFADCTGK
jgi:hypothetical protein